VPTISKLDAGESACFSGINFSSPGLPEERQPAIGSNITIFLQYRVSFGPFLAFDRDRPDLSLLELMTRSGVLVGSLRRSFRTVGPQLTCGSPSLPTRIIAVSHHAFLFLEPSLSQPTRLELTLFRPCPCSCEASGATLLYRGSGRYLVVRLDLETRWLTMLSIAPLLLRHQPCSVSSVLLASLL
jgi:hypothetical protein